MSTMNRKHYSKLYSSISTIKGKFKCKEERCKHKITLRRVIKEETEELDEKPLHDLQVEIDPLENKVGVHE